MQREPAPEFELTVHLVSLAAKARLELHPLRHQPFRGVEAVADQNVRKFRIGAVLRQLKQIVEKLRLRVGPEIDVDEIFLRERGQDGNEIVHAIEGKAEGATGEMRIAAAFLERRGFEHCDPRPMLMGGDRGAQRGIAGSDHQHVRLAGRVDHVAAPRTSAVAPDILAPSAALRTSSSMRL